MIKEDAFLVFINKHHFNKFASVAEDYLNDNIDLIEDKLHDYQNYFTHEVINKYIDKVFVSDSNGDNIEFGVKLILEIEVEYEFDSHHDYESKMMNISILVTCIGSLEDKLEHIEIVDCEKYTGYSKVITNDLLYKINSNEYQRYANEILDKYLHYDYVNGNKIDPMKLAKEMGLNVIKRSITKDKSIFGQIYFEDCNVELYNSESNCSENVSIKANTILVDSETAYLVSYGSENLTISHECVHWYLHRKAFKLARILNDSLKMIQCKVSGGIKGMENMDKQKWMEIQANGIAPYILMPDKVIDNCISDNKKWVNLLGNNNELSLAHASVSSIASNLSVTIYAAKRRLILKGNKYARGVFEYIDGHYVEPYYYSDEIESNQSYTISSIYATSILNDLNGDYEPFVFVENHICLNDTKYVSRLKNGKYILTSYAREHVDECCIVFDISVLKNNNEIVNKNYSFCYLCKGAKFGNITYQPKFNPSSNIKKITKAQILFEQQQLEKKLRVIEIMSLPDALLFLMKELELTNESLAYKSGLSSKTISRYRTGETKNFEKEVLVSMCVGMNLPKNTARLFVERCGCKPLNPNDLRDYALGIVLDGMTYLSIDEVNRELLNMEQEILKNK